VPRHIAAAVREKQRRDDIQTAELISSGTPTVPIMMRAPADRDQLFRLIATTHSD
jgi:hypothetical protein